jgi:hypothetical protein
MNAVDSLNLRGRDSAFIQKQRGTSQEARKYQKRATLAELLFRNFFRKYGFADRMTD